MPTQIKLPRLGQGMDEGKILKWLKNEGDKVASGDEIYEVETEKVNVEVEAPASGTLLKIVVGEGNEVPIGTVIGWIGDKGEDVPDVEEAQPAAKTKPAAETPSQPKAKAQPKPDSPAKKSDSARSSDVDSPRAEADDEPVDDDGRVKASPLARRMGAERGIDLARVTGSGPNGRIVARDLADVAQASAAESTSATSTSAAVTGDTERVPLTKMRQTIARRLTEAWQAPVFSLTVNIEMTAANELRAALVARMQEGDTKPTVSDILTKACAVSLRRHRDMNVHFVGDAILRFAGAHIGMAVATDNGLVVPVIRDAHAKTIGEIASDRAELVGRARAGRLTPDDFEGGTFTISNLGMMGIDEFTAVINPPMAGILAVGRTADTPVAINRRVEIRPIMTVTISCDHRAVDGAVGARFLASVKEALESPLTML